jgi:hypothetical protein
MQRDVVLACRLLERLGAANERTREPRLDRQTDHRLAKMRGEITQGVAVDFSLSREGTASPGPYLSLA